ncbi:hypothetical protein AB0Y38_18220 [Lysinibacillus capsici]|uniref:hypothetical protein n=1 Tax=Lysinibacillus capsici TaxID=2115968 RepID=UPI003F28A5E5
MRKITKILTALFATFIVFGFVNKASASELTQEQQEAYYAEYVSIIEETNSKYNKNLQLGPIEGFSVDSWKTPEEFKNIVTDMATQEWVAVEEKPGIGLFASTSGTKSVSKYLSGQTVTITVNGSFNTILSNGRQIFSPNINSLTSYASKGTWTQRSYTSSLIDGGRTYNFDIGGGYVYNDVYDATNISVSFYCSSTGVVQ